MKKKKSQRVLSLDCPKSKLSMSSTLDIPFGELFEQKLIDLPKSGNSRVYHIYIPATIIDSSLLRIKKQEIPMIVAMHCYGCGVATMFDTYQSLADTYGFILIIPEGLQFSWNAIECCVSFVCYWFENYFI
jgi:poly(3-hydroxybutyrate) depolymerase